MTEEEAKRNIEELHKIMVLVTKLPANLIAPVYCKEFLGLMEGAQNRCYQALGKIYHKEFGL